MKILSDGCDASKAAEQRRLPPAGESDPLAACQLIAPVRSAIASTRQWLLAEQHADGHWVGELEGDTILESEYILLLAYLGQESSEQARRAAESTR